MKIRVLELLATLKRAGAEQVAVSLACRLERDRFETAVVSLFDAFPGGLEPVLARHGVRTWHLGKRQGLDLLMYPRLSRIFREFQPQIIHTHSYLLRYSLPARLAGGPGAMVHTVHNLAEKEVDLFGRMIHRIAFRCGVQPVAVAAEVERSFRAVYGFEPVATIPNGIDTGHFFRPEAREPWRREQGFSPGDILVASVARLDPQKNTLGLIESFASALGGDPRCHLLLAGDGALAEQARGLALSRGVAERVHFLGVRQDVPELLSASDIFILASHWEGNPISVLEAMAAGLPVIATAVGGVPGLIDHPATGILVPPGDARSLKVALASLAHDAPVRRQLAEAARRHSARFDAGAMVAAYAALFERLSGTRT